MYHGVGLNPVNRLQSLLLLLVTEDLVVLYRGRGTSGGVYVGLLVLERFFRSLLLIDGQRSLVVGRLDVAILNKFSPTSDFHLISRMHDRWSPGERLAEIHDPASSGRSGDRYAASIGCRPQRVPRRNVGVAGRDGCRDRTPSLMRRPGPVSAVFSFPLMVFSFASINKMRRSLFLLHCLSIATRSFLNLVQGLVSGKSISRLLPSVLLVNRARSG